MEVIVQAVTVTYPKSQYSFCFPGTIYAPKVEYYGIISIICMEKLCMIKMRIHEASDMAYGEDSRF